MNGCGLQDGGDGEHGGYACAVIGDAGAQESVAFLTNFERALGGENGVDMSAECDVGASLRETRFARVNAEDVAGFVDTDIVEAKFAETLGEPFAAGGFSEGWRGNAGQFHLPALEFGLGGAKPIASLLDLGDRG